MRLLLVSLLVVFSTILSAQLYKSMMDDPSVNFYDVVSEAESYFADKEKGKGSGWTPYQRWKNANESLFYPSGDRAQFNSVAQAKKFEKIKNSSHSVSKMSGEYDWVELGPYTTDSITSHYAPGLGRVECVYADPLNEQTIYMSSRSSGFWRSVDGGASWVNTTTDLGVTGVNTFAVNPTNANEIFINLRNGRNGVTHGIYKSIDGGVSWTETVFSPDNLNIGGWGTSHSVNEIQYHPQNPDTIIVCSSEGIYRSIDGFATIQEVEDIGGAQVEFHPTNPDILYFTRSYYWSRNEFWRSTDGGATLSTNLTITANNYSGAKLATCSAAPNVVFFYSGSGVWKSTDSGISFNFITGSDQFGSTFGVSQDNVNVFLKGVLNIYRSSDGGVNWTQATEWYLPSATTTNYVHADMRYLFFTNGSFYVGTDGYLVKTPDNGITWSILNEGTSLRENYKLGTSQSHKDVTSCGSQDNGSSFYDHGLWKEYIGADGMEQIVHPLEPSWAVGSIQYGNKQRTKNRAQSVQGINSHEGFSRSWEAPLAYDPLYFNTIYSLGTKMVKSENFGDSWNEVYEFGGETAKQFALAENDSKIMLVSIRDTLLKSMDGGVSFNRIGQAALPGYFIEDIAFDPEDDNRFIVVYAQWQDNNSRVFMSEDGGATFVNISYNISAFPTRSVVIDYGDDPIIYVGTDKGVFTKPLSANSYTLFSDNMPESTIEELEINYASNTIKAVTWGRGLWENKLLGKADFVHMNSIEMDQNGAEGIQEFIDNYLRVEIDDYEKVDSVYLRYKVNNLGVETMVMCSFLEETLLQSDASLPNFAVGDTVRFRVFARHKNGSLTKSYPFMYYVNIAKPPYCDASGDGATVDWIDLVELANISNSSGKTGYSNFSSISATMEQFSTDTLWVRLNHDFAGSDKAGAWVDWNDSGIFEDNERIQMSAYNTDKRSFGILTVPTDVTSGKYRLRVRNSYFGDEAYPCGTTAGEVEDYSIFVTAGCAKGLQLSSTADAGTNSLRELIKLTCPTDTIFVDSTIIMDTLVTYNGPIVISDPITIYGLDGQYFVISGNESHRIFEVQEPTNLANLKLINGVDSPDGGAFLNQSIMELRNVVFEGNKEGTLSKPFTNQGEIQIIIGETTVKE